MKDQAIQTLENEGVPAAIKLLQESHLSLTERVPLYDELHRHAYWQQKDLPAAIQVGQAGIRLGEDLAESRPDLARQILSQVKAILYNLASFTWPGWDEEGIEITPAQRRLGQDAARQNLDLAVQLKKPSLPLSRAYWMLGAHQIADGEYVQARARFTMAEKAARDAESLADELLSRGFGRVAGLLADPGSQTLEDELAEIKAALLKEEHGEFFVKQLDDALRVFGN